MSRRRLTAPQKHLIPVMMGDGITAPPFLTAQVAQLTDDGTYSLACGTAGQALPVDFVDVADDWTIAANTDLGNATPDTHFLAYRIRGNLTIDEGVTVTPTARKLGLLLLVDGALTVNGILDMTERGANHSDDGGSDLEAFDIRIYEISDETDNILPAVGADGAASRSNRGHGLHGSAGVDGQTGGGGSGAKGTDDNNYAGAGADGTSFSGGPGGGSARGGYPAYAQDGGPRGGPGGDSAGASSSAGSGNPGGVGVTKNGLDGTGGILILVVQGNVTIGSNGIIRANGTEGGGEAGAMVGGGGTGGGSITLCHAGTYTNNGTLQANGGPIGNGTNRNGGAGGAGSVRTVDIS